MVVVGEPHPHQVAEVQAHQDGSQRDLTSSRSESVRVSWLVLEVGVHRHEEHDESEGQQRHGVDVVLHCVDLDGAEVLVPPEGRGEGT